MFDHPHLDLIDQLECAPDAVPLYGGTLQAAISDLMDEIPMCEDADRRVQLAALEMRGRLVLERWRMRCGKN